MRTTLTLENDVAIAIERLRRARNRSLKDIVNQVLREGLKRFEARSETVTPFRTETVSLGRCLIGDVEDVSEALAIAEGEDFR